jgi:hypothetical protein
MLSIEPSALDLEWVSQPVNYMELAELAEKASEIARKEKENLELVDATLSRTIRSEFEREKIKVTEALISASVITHLNHRNAFESYNKALYQEGIAKAAVRDMDHKKSALENLVKLCLGSYFAAPKEPRDLVAEHRKLTKVDTEAVREQLIRESAKERRQI